MKFSNDLIAKAKSCKSTEEVAALAKQHGVELSEEEAAEAFAYLNKKGELSEEELGAATGGGEEWSCDVSGKTPLYSVGDRVGYYNWSIGRVYHTGTIKSVSDDRKGLHAEWLYYIDGDDGIESCVYEHQITKL